MLKRLWSFILALLLLITASPFFSITADAAYENTYVNTGNQAADIIGVAKTQLGYTEGSNNYTKYGEWYGMADEAWCGMFVSWCANQAGIPTSVLKKYARSNPEGYGLTRLDGANYRPKPGDLFFKKSLTHVGIVYYLDGDYFYTLEGNSGAGSNKVVSQRKKISDFYFGSPKYYGGGDHSYSTETESAHPHKEYRICSHCGDKYYTGNTSTASDCTTCIQNACSHSYGAWATDGDSKHKRTCSLCEKLDTANHNWNTGTILEEATCAKSGSKEQTCKDCNAERTVTISKTDRHDFDDAVFIDDENHRMECKVCRISEKEAHTENEQWLTDELAHWYECTDCGERYSYAEHVFPDGCETPCETCGYIPAEGHVISEVANNDETGHWFDCQNCDKQIDYKEHHFNAECSEKCDGCDFARVTEHKYSENWLNDDANHWQECSVCGQKKGEAEHTPNNAQEWEDLTCTTCQLILRSGDDHIHAYHDVEHDNRTHWGTCVCGFEMATEAHSWSMQTNKCSICSADYVAQIGNSDSMEMINWAIMFGAAVVLFTVIAILVAKAGKRMVQNAQII